MCGLPSVGRPRSPSLRERRSRFGRGPDRGGRRALEDPPGAVRARPPRVHGRHGLARTGSEGSSAGSAAQSRRHELDRPRRRSEEHTSELQSLMRISYAVFCLLKTISFFFSFFSFFFFFFSFFFF